MVIALLSSVDGIFKWMSFAFNTRLARASERAFRHIHIINNSATASSSSRFLALRSDRVGCDRISRLPGNAERALEARRHEAVEGGG